jgi:hypothetical protein
VCSELLRTTPSTAVSSPTSGTRLRLLLIVVVIAVADALDDVACISVPFAASASSWRVQ